MPTYEAKSLIVPNCGKTELTQAVNVILGALAKGKAIKAASLEDLDALPDTISETDSHQSVGIVLCCALSLSLETKSKATGLIENHFSALVGFMSDDKVGEIIDVVVPRVIREECGEIDRRILKKLAKIANRKSPVLAWKVVNSTLKSSNLDQILLHKNLWILATELLNSEGEKITKPMLVTSYEHSLERTVEILGRFGISGSMQFTTTAKPYLALFEELCERVKLDSVSEVAQDQVFHIATVLSAMIEESSNARLQRLMTQLLEGITESKSAGRRLFGELKNMLSPQYSYSDWFKESYVDPNRAVLNLLLSGLSQCTTLAPLSLYASEWISLLFNLLVSQWSKLQREPQYDKLLHTIVDITFKFSISYNVANMECLGKIIAFCQAHLFSPHPLLHNLALDIWCILLQSSSVNATRDVPNQLGALAVHVVNRYFPKASTSSSIPLSTSMLHALTPIRLKLQSILFRALFCVPKNVRPEIDKSPLASFPLFNILAGTDQKLGDSDLFLLSVLPLNLMPQNPRYEHVLTLLSEMMPRSALVKDDESSARALLCTRAIYNLLAQSNEKWSPTALAPAYRNVTSALQSFQTSLSGEGIDGELLSSMLDLFSLPAIRPQVPWKKLVLDLNKKFHIMTSVVKISFMQFISEHALASASHELIELAPTLLVTFDALFDDSDWCVAAEALVAFYPVAKKIPFEIKQKDSVKQLFDFFLKPTESPAPLSAKAEKFLASLASPPDAELTSALEALRVHLLRFAEERIGTSNTDQTLLQEFLKANERLAGLETGLASSNSIVL